ncbi:hypothetical protein LCGC14_2323320, partial [marine sediment metagenome]
MAVQGGAPCIDPHSGRGRIRSGRPRGRADTERHGAGAERNTSNSIRTVSDVVPRLPRSITSCLYARVAQMTKATINRSARHAILERRAR